MLLCLAAAPASARTLAVGPGAPYATPHDAAAAAQDGDSVVIAPGEYFDCAVWHANRLTIAGGGPGVVLTDTACQGKAAFVVTGDGVVLRALSFIRVRVGDGNGAGVRAEGRDLTVSGSRFDNDQVGILAAGGGTLTVEDCSFAGTSVHAIDAANLDRLRVAHSAFGPGRGGDAITAAVARSELAGNRFDAGGFAGPLVHLAGGDLRFTDNTIAAAGAAAGDRPGMVLATGSMDEIVLRGNTLTGAGDAPLLRNWTGTTARAEANSVPPGGAVVSEDGSTYHRLRATAAAVLAWLHRLVAAARHLLGAALRAVV